MKPKSKELSLPDIVLAWHDLTPEEFDEIHWAVAQGHPKFLQSLEEMVAGHGEVTCFLSGVVLGKRMAEKQKPRPAPRGYRGSVLGGS